MNKLILGLDDFGKAVSKRLNFIDKSLFIKELLDNANIEATVIIRPRRFGKTFNMSMLHHFLAPEVDGLKTKGLFDNLKIAKAGDVYMREQGQYPVISLSLKTIKHTSYVKTKESLAKLLSQLYTQHYYLLSSDTLYPHEKSVFERILNQQASDSDLISSLFDLSVYLYRHHHTKPWLLIDEYDTPLQSAYLHDYYQPMIEFMRDMFGSALKGNSNIQRAVITGILQIAKENLFSGVNNLKVFSVLSREYAEHFGFTEAEVDEVLRQSGLDHLSLEVKAWYNGYRIGDQQIYNPWSIANCVNERGLLKPYWINTSDNVLIKQEMACAEAGVKKKFESLLSGQPIQAQIKETTVFSDLNRDGESLWGLLLLSGYLTALTSKQVGIKTECSLIPPNQEVASLYPDIIVSWFLDALGEDNYHLLLSSLIEGKLDVFLEILQKFLLESASYFDVKGSEPEKFYHGFVMGLIVGLADTHRIHSNKESGYGRYDVMLIPKNHSKLGLVIEFKVAKNPAMLQQTAEEALAQINTLGYETELQHQGIQKILKIGLGFHGKTVALASNFSE